MAEQPRKSEEAPACDVVLENKTSSSNPAEAVTCDKSHGVKGTVEAVTTAVTADKTEGLKGTGEAVTTAMTADKTEGVKGTAEAVTTAMTADKTEGVKGTVEAITTAMTADKTEGVKCTVEAITTAMTADKTEGVKGTAEAINGPVPDDETEVVKGQGGQEPLSEGDSGCSADSTASSDPLSDLFIVEKILDRKIVKDRKTLKNQYFYKIRWEGYKEENDTWEPKENLNDCREMIQKCDRRKNEEVVAKHMKAERKVSKWVGYEEVDVAVDTVKDKFWDNLEEGKYDPIRDGGGDMFSKIKTQGRSARPTSFANCFGGARTKPTDSGTPEGEKKGKDKPKRAAARAEGGGKGLTRSRSTSSVEAPTGESAIGRKVQAVRKRKSSSPLVTPVAVKVRKVEEERGKQERNTRAKNRSRSSKSCSEAPIPSPDAPAQPPPVKQPPIRMTIKRSMLQTYDTKQSTVGSPTEPKKSLKSELLNINSRDIVTSYKAYVSPTGEVKPPPVFSTATSEVLQAGPSNPSPPPARPKEEPEEVETGKTGQESRGAAPAAAAGEGVKVERVPSHPGSGDSPHVVSTSCSSALPAPAHASPVGVTPSPENPEPTSTSDLPLRHQQGVGAGQRGSRSFVEEALSANAPDGGSAVDSRREAELLGKQQKADEKLEELLMANNLIEVHQLLWQDVKPTLQRRDSLGRTPLLLATDAQLYEAVDLLVMYGADVNATDHSGATPLILAAHKGNDAIVGLLLEGRAQLNTMDNSGEAALTKAIKGGHLRVMNLLLRNGADWELKPGVKDDELTPRAVASHLPNQDPHDLLTSHLLAWNSAFVREVNLSLQNIAKVQHQILPLRCVSLAETSRLALDFSCPNPHHQEGTTNVLFMGHARLRDGKLDTRLHGACAVVDVQLNGIRLNSISNQGMNFILSFCPLRTENHLVIKTVEAPHTNLKLLFSAFKINTRT